MTLKLDDVLEEIAGEPGAENLYTEEQVDRITLAAHADIEAFTSRLHIEIKNRDLALKQRKELLEERSMNPTQVKLLRAVERIADMLLEDDGQAWKEARKFMERCDLAEMVDGDWRAKPMFALFRDDKQISKMHSDTRPCLIEAVQRGLVFCASADFTGDKSGTFLADGVEVRRV